MEIANQTNTEIKRPFVGYEYKEVLADRAKADFLMDGYENFGWEILGYQKEQKPDYSPYQTKVQIRMRRNRKIANKMELTRLQRHFEACVGEIEALERSKTAQAFTYAILVGLIGTAFMAGAVFAVVAEPPKVLLCILLAIPAFLGWIFPYFIYTKTVERQTRKINPMIEIKYDEIYEICEKGNKLLGLHS